MPRRIQLQPWERPRGLSVLSIGLTMGLSIALSLGATACGDDANAAPPGRRPRQDAAGTGGASTGGASGSGAHLPDAGAEPPEPADAVVCRADASGPLELRAPADVVADSLSLAFRGNLVAVAWSERRAGQQDIFVRRLDAEGEASAEQRVSDDWSLSQQPSVLGDAEGWTVAWSDNREGAYDVYLQRLDLDLSLVDAPVRLTHTTSAARRPSLQWVAGDMLAAWVASLPGSETAEVVTQRLSEMFAPVSGPQAVTAQDSAPVAGRLKLIDGAPLVVWVEKRTAASNVQLQLLDAAGLPSGDLLTYAVEGNADGSVDLASVGSTAGLVFGVRVAGARSDVRFQPLASDGTAAGNERVVSSSDPGFGASVAALAGGYAVSYWVPTSGDAGQILRMAFLDATGSVLQRADVTTLDGASESQHTQLGVTHSGELIVAWEELGASGTSIRAARVRCGL